MLSLNQVRSGAKIVFKGAPHEVLEANHLKVGRGGAKLTTRLRNLLDQAVIDYTFAGEEKLEEADVSYQAAQFLYSENGRGYFMKSDNFEQTDLLMTTTQAKYLREGGVVDLIVWQDHVITIQLPKKVILTVTYTEPVAKGNTVNALTKDATVDSGATIRVPSFIKVGDNIEVNTESGLYTARV